MAEEHYLNTTQLGRLWAKIKALFSTAAPIDRGIEYIRGTWTATSGTWTGVSQDTELYDGKQIILYMPFAGSGNATLNLTLADGSTTGAKNVYYENITRFTTHKSQNSQLHLIYHKAQTLSNGTTYEGWWYVANRDTNDLARVIQFYNTIVAKSAIAAQSIIAGDASGYEQIKAGVSFDLTYPVLWTIGAIAANDTSYSYLYIQYYDRNLGANYNSFTGKKNSIVYIVGTVSGNTFTVGSDVLTCTVPSSDDGKAYIPIGRLGNKSNGQNYFNFSTFGPVHLFAYKEGAFREISGWAEYAANASSVPASGVTGTLGVDHGGTGQTSATNAANALINALGVGTSVPTDNDYYVAQYVGGGTTTTTYHRRPVSALWDYIKNKIKAATDLGYLKLSGGTMTGKLTLQGSQCADAYNSGALDLKNSNINGVNSIYTANLSDNAQEGIHFYTDATHVDSLHARGGVLYFTPYRTIGEAGTSYEVIRDDPRGYGKNYLNIHPENKPVLIPFMHNDIAHLLKRGGSAVVQYDGVTQSVNITNVFDGSGSYWAINPTSLGITELVFELTLHKVFTYSNWIYADFGNISWRASGVKIEAMNTNYANDIWTEKYNTTTNADGHVAVTMSHTPVGASHSGDGFNKIRFTFTGLTVGASTSFRIAQLGIYNFGSYGLRETCMSRGNDDYLFRNLTPNSNGTYSLGDASHKWKEIHGTLKGNADTATNASKVNSHTVNSDVPSNAVFTDTQADWNETDTTSAAYIANKPTIPEGAVVDSALSATSTNPVQNKAINTALGNKVDKVSGKGLSANDLTDTLLTKLNGIATGAEVNVQSDWNVTDTSSDAYIKNKPTIPVVPSAATATPKMDGTGAAGSGTTWARADHVHPTDTSLAPKSHASTATTYGVGTTSNYGHVKTQTGDMNGTSSTNGIAAGLGHTHSNYVTTSVGYAHRGTVDAGGDANDCVELGSYSFTSTNNSTSAYSNLPSGVTWGNLYVWRNGATGNLISQLLAVGSSGLYYRMRIDATTWKSWVHLTDDSGVVNRLGVLTDGKNLNAVRDCGIYYINSSSTHSNMPSTVNSDIHDYGLLVVFDHSNGSDITGQLFISDNGYAIRYRTTETWSAWAVTDPNVYESSYTKSGLTVYVRKIGHTVTMNIAGTTSAALATSNANVVLCTLAERYRPSRLHDTVGFVTNGTTGARYGRVYISAGGEVGIGYTYQLGSTPTAATIPASAAVRYATSWTTD